MHAPARFPFARRARGMSMMEMLVATAIFSLLIVMAFQISIFTSRAAAEKLTGANVEVKGERTLKMIVEALTVCTAIAVNPGNATITYNSPFDIDNSGTPLYRNTQSLERGIITAAGSGNGTMTFTFVKEKSVSEATEQLDLNQDGDTLDSFDMGWIERSSTLAGDVPEIIGVTNIVQRKDNWGRPILSDGAPTDGSGRIFFRDMTSENTKHILQINLMLLAISEDRLVHMIQCKGQVFLRNQGNN